MQSKRYSWHPCVHCHGYLVHLQQNGFGPWPDTTAPGTHSSLVHRFSTSPAAAVLLQNLNASNNGVPNTNSPKVFSKFFSLYSVSKCVFWQAQSLKNSRQFFQQDVINSTPVHLTCCILFEGAVFTWKFRLGNLASKACLWEDLWPHSQVCQGRTKVWGTTVRTKKSLTRVSAGCGKNSSLLEEQFELLWCHKFYSTNWINWDLLRY